MSFFDEVPPPDEPQPEYRTPPWLGAPDNVLPASVAVDVRLARGDRVGVAICGARVYPAGLSFGLTVVRRHRQDLSRRPHHPLLFHGPRQEGDPRFGVAFADGRKTTLDARREPPRGAGPAEIVLARGGGGGSERSWEGRFWLWPLPPEGPLTFGFAWPAEGIDETTVGVDSEPLREASARAVTLWPDERPELPRDGGGGWSAYAD